MRLLLANKTPSLEIAMLYYWWLYTVVAPVVVLDMLLRACPLYRGAWPLGLDYLAEDY
jgi:hypothetical protein